MKIKLEALNDVEVGTVHYKPNHTFKRGEVVDADFTSNGVNLLMGNCWSMDIKIERIEKSFKVWNQ